MMSLPVTDLTSCDCRCHFLCLMLLFVSDVTSCDWYISSLCLVGGVLSSNVFTINNSWFWLYLWKLLLPQERRLLFVSHVTGFHLVVVTQFDYAFFNLTTNLMFLSTLVFAVLLLEAWSVFLLIPCYKMLIKCPLLSTGDGIWVVLFPVLIACC